MTQVFSRDKEHICGASVFLEEKKEAQEDFSHRVCQVISASI